MIRTVYSSHDEGDKVTVYAADTELPLLLALVNADGERLSVFLKPDDVDKVVRALERGRDA